MNRINTFSNEPNPHLRRLAQMQEAKSKWQESEQLLNYLRTHGPDKPKQPSDEELLQWAQNRH